MLLIALLNLYLQLFLLTSRVACDILCNAFRFTPEKEICTMDMDKNINISLLIDFYGDMLSDKQREAAELYYNEDLSLSEISDITGLTRPGVRDRLVKSERILRDLEEKLGLLKRFQEMGEEIASITEELEAHKNGKAVDLGDIIERLKKLS